MLFFLVFFSPFSIAITSLREEGANLSAFRTFVQFALVWFCLGWAAVCNCGTSRTFLLPFFLYLFHTKFRDNVFNKSRHENYLT